MPTTITDLPLASEVSPDTVVAADNAQGTATEKLTLSQIVSLAGNVSSSTINNIVVLTETAYEELTETDSSTLYVVTPNPDE
jgi:hypothetical protein